MVAMDTKDIINMGLRAKSETEEFINRHLHDRAKGWPINSFWDSKHDESWWDKQLRERAVFQT